jgi:hypothetical protein
MVQIFFVFVASKVIEEISQNVLLPFVSMVSFIMVYIGQ